jgi:hypothetical protein
MLCLALAAVVFALRWRRSPEKETIDRFAVVEAVRKVLKVATVETQIAEVVTYHDVKEVLFFFSSEKNAIIRVQGKVNAGFDLTSKRLEVSFEETSRLLRIRLPRARVLSIDPTIEILNERSGWQNTVTREDRNLWYKWARGDLRRAAIKSGITDQAEKNARELATALAAAYGARLEISFEEDGESTAEPEETKLVEPSG